ncbi:exodeoxyribonuclease VII large subunit [Candidatus Latescibacterota bacterium]
MKEFLNAIMNEMETYFDKDLFSGNLKVSELTRLLKRLIEENIPVVSVVGELSNYVHHSSGHLYFTLKDESSQIKCVMFKWQAVNIDFNPEEGMALNAVGNVTVYERSGQYQLNVIRLVPLGRGELFFQLEEIKKKLAAEGVFDNERPIPHYPAVVGVVTSPTGAAVRDIISVISRRAPNVRIILRPATVQGDDAPPDIVEGIRDLNHYKDVDVIIVGRGGGSIEDLWCFNDEHVARAIASSEKPVISAVGHETDFTLADFAADLRAPTPSAAGELVVKDMKELKQVVAGYNSLLKRGVLKYIDDAEMKLEHAKRGLSSERFLQTLLLKSQVVDEQAMRINNAGFRAISEKEKITESLKSKLVALNPSAVLKRGYSIVYKTIDSSVVDEYTKVRKGEGISIELAKGGIRAKVEDAHE